MSRHLLTALLSSVYSKSSSSSESADPDWTIVHLLDKGGNRVWDFTVQDKEGENWVATKMYYTDFAGRSWSVYKKKSEVGEKSSGHAGLLNNNFFSLPGSDSSRIKDDLDENTAIIFTKSGFVRDESNIYCSRGVFNNVHGSGTISGVCESNTGSENKLLCQFPISYSNLDGNYNVKTVAIKKKDLVKVGFCNYNANDLFVILDKTSTITDLYKNLFENDVLKTNFSKDQYLGTISNINNLTFLDI